MKKLLDLLYNFLMDRETARHPVLYFISPETSDTRRETARPRVLYLGRSQTTISYVIASNAAIPFNLDDF
jgi:hypothetical protein